jgi:hypothetical protein
VQNNGMNTNTSFTSSSSSSTGSGVTAGFNASGFVGINLEENAGFIASTCVAAFKMTVSVDLGVNHTKSTEQELALDLTYAQGLADDGVVVSIVPYDRFVYEITGGLNPGELELGLEPGAAGRHRAHGDTARAVVHGTPARGQEAGATSAPPLHSRCSSVTAMSRGRATRSARWGVSS